MTINEFVEELKKIEGIDVSGNICNGEVSIGLKQVDLFYDFDERSLGILQDFTSIYVNGRTPEEVLEIAKNLMGW